MHKTEFDALSAELAELARESKNMVIVVVSLNHDQEKGFQTLTKSYGTPSLHSFLIAMDELMDLRSTIKRACQKRRYREESND